jgi:predicted Zn-dependent protease
MLARLRQWLLAPFRTRVRAAWTAAALVLLAGAAWHGLRVCQYSADQAAAEAALAIYDFPEAERRLKNCLRLRPADAPTLLLAAQAARRDGRLDDAQEYLDRYPESDLDSALQWVLVRVQGGSVGEHVYDLIEQLEIRHPASEQIIEALAQGSVHVYRLNEARFWTKQLLERFPKNPVGRMLEAQTDETMRRREHALEIVRGLVEEYPHFDKARLYLADLLAKDRLYDEAAEHYAALYQTRPDDVAPLLGLVRCLVMVERLDEAEPLVRELQARHAQVSAALLECGRFALRRGRPAEAEPVLRRAAELSPHDHEIHHELAVCLGQLGRRAESERHLERFRQIESDLKLLDAAFQAMTKAPNDPAPRWEAGRICLRNGQTAEGLRWLAGALQADPNHAPTHLTLAEHFAAQGNESQAAYHRQRLAARR